MSGLDRVRRFALDGAIRDMVQDTGCTEDDAWLVVDASDRAGVADDPAYNACVRDLLRSRRVPAALVHTLAAQTDEPLPDVLDAVAGFREMNADGCFPFALVAAGLGVPEDLMTDDEWNAWCADG